MLKFTEVGLSMMNLQRSFEIHNWSGMSSSDGCKNCRHKLKKKTRMRDLWINEKKPVVEVDYEELARKRTQPNVVLQSQVGLKNVFDGLLLRRQKGSGSAGSVDLSPIEIEEELKFTRMIGILR